MSTKFETLFEEGIRLFQTGQLHASLKLWQKLQRKCRETGNLYQEAKFYQNLQQGMKAAVALNQAQRWLLRVTKLEMEAWVQANQDVLSHTLRISLRRQINQLLPDRPFENPRHWAAFCAIGQ